MRLTPTWVPRSFLHPGKRIKLAPTDWYAYGAHRGGIDERWFASTTEAANENRTPDEGLSYVAFEGSGSRCATPWPKPAPADRQGDVRQVQALAGLLEVLRQHGPHPASHAPESKHAALTGQEGKPESYYFPPQLNNVDNNFAYTFMGLEPGTTKAQLRKCLENWNKGDNGILDLSRAYRLQARHRLADSARRAARPRLAVHLRAAMGLRRVRHVPVAGRRPRGALVAAGQGHAARTSTTTSTSSSSSSTGRRTSTRISRSTTTWSRSSTEPRSGPATPIAGSSTARSTASNFSRQGADARSRRQVHAQGSRRQRLDHRAGPRPDGQARICKRPP